MGIGDWGLGIGPNAQSQIPNPKSPNKLIYLICILYFLLFKLYYLTYYLTYYIILYNIIL